MEKQIIIAICGKSAAGKDYLAKQLYYLLNKKKYKCNYIVSDTSRPRRINEKDGVDYNFLTEDNFCSKINKENYLEYSYFNNWYYGTSKDTIKDGINVGVFNPEGIKSLSKYKDKYDVYCIYLTAGFFTRMKRAIQREHKIKFEYFRRAFADFKDFKELNKFIENNYEHIITKSRCNKDCEVNTVYGFIFRNILNKWQ